MNFRIRSVLKWAGGAVILFVVVLACFIAGLLEGHREEQVIASGTDAAFTLAALRKLHANDVAGAKVLLLSTLESKIVTHSFAARPFFEYPAPTGDEAIETLGPYLS